MPFRNKEECLRLAEEFGIKGADEMPWPQLQKEVSARVKMAELGVEPNKVNTDRPVQAPRKKYVDPRSKAERDLDKYRGKTILLSPELKPERYRLVKYDEVLGNDMEVVERKFDMDPNTDVVFDVAGGEMDYDKNRIDAFHDYITGTYRLKNKSDRKVVAMSSVPKENSGMLFRPGIDYAVVVTWQGRSGYLWNHWRYPNVKSLLIASGYYQEYKDRFKDEPNVWYAAGKQLVCDPHLVHQIFAEIEEKERRKYDDGMMRRKFYRGEI